MANVGRYARGQVMLAYEMIGGVERLAEWAEENPGEFFTKLFGKTVTRETEVHASEGVEQLLERLGEAEGAAALIEDAEFEVIEG